MQKVAAAQTRLPRRPQKRRASEQVRGWYQWTRWQRSRGWLRRQRQRHRAGGIRQYEVKREVGAWAPKTLRDGETLTAARAAGQGPRRLPRAPQRAWPSSKVRVSVRMGAWPGHMLSHQPILTSRRVVLEGGATGHVLLEQHGCAIASRSVPPWVTDGTHLPLPFG